jgi:hypothetical protein
MKRLDAVLPVAAAVAVLLSSAAQAQRGASPDITRCFSGCSGIPTTYQEAPAPLLAAGVPSFIAVGGGALIARRRRGRQK